MKHKHTTAALLATLGLAFSASAQDAAHAESHGHAEAHGHAEGQGHAEAHGNVTLQANRIVIDKEGNRIVIAGDQGGRVVFEQDGDGPRHQLNADEIIITGPRLGAGDQIPLVLVEAAYLGVNAMPIDHEAGEKLGLPRGIGLRIDFVVEDSPAHQSGLKPGDIITFFNDQKLINAEQLAVLVRMQKAGDLVELKLLRDGKPREIIAKLVTKEVPKLGPGGANLTREWNVQLGGPVARGVEVFPGVFLGDGVNNPNLPLWVPRPELDHELPADVREQIEQMKLEIKRQMLENRVEVERQIEQMRKELDLDLDKLRGDAAQNPGPAGGHRQMQAEMVQINDGYKLHLKINNNERRLTITDRNGKVLFDGPVPEDGKIKDLPAGLQRTVDAMLAGTILIEQPEQGGR